MDGIRLYAGDKPNRPEYEGLIGLTKGKAYPGHISCDITERHPFDDETVDSYQSEDVFEHIAFEKLPEVLHDIYRILKPGGYLRLSVPDYRSDIIRNRCIIGKNDEIIDDPGMGHLWFPVIESVRFLLEQTEFTYIQYQFHNISGVSITIPIDYSLGYIQRTPDNDDRVKNPYRAMSIVIDCFKSII